MEVQYDMKTVTNEQALNVLSKMEKSLQTQLDIAKSKASPEQRKRLFSDEIIDEQKVEVDDREMMGF